MTSSWSLAVSCSGRRRWSAWAASKASTGAGASPTGATCSPPPRTWGPAGNTNPGYTLEWERFQARLATEFLAWQRDLLKPLIGPKKRILHCTVSGWGSRWPDPHEIAKSLDVAAANIYVAM